MNCVLIFPPTCSSFLLSVLLKQKELKCTHVYLLTEDILVRVIGDNCLTSRRKETDLYTCFGFLLFLRGCSWYF